MTGVFGWRTFIPLHQITRARPCTNKHGQEMAEIFLREGRVSSDEVTWERFGETPLHLIPAEPGTSLLHVWFDAEAPEGYGVDRTPLIGWALCLDNEIRPVTPSGVNDSISVPEFGSFVEMPNGKVVSTSPWADRSSFDDVAAFSAYVVGEREGQRAATDDAREPGQ